MKGLQYYEVFETTATHLIVQCFHASVHWHARAFEKCFSITMNYKGVYAEGTKKIKNSNKMQYFISISSLVFAFKIKFFH